jgi:peptide/nickel transport system permease protein
MAQRHLTYWQTVWRQFERHKLGVAALVIVALFVLVGIYAPLLASSKPLMVRFEGHWFFPLFRYLFFPGFFSKRLDIFYNLLMFTFPLFITAWIGLKNWPQLRNKALLCIGLLQMGLFIYLILFPFQDPAFSPELLQLRQREMIARRDYLNTEPLFNPPLLSSWEEELNHMTPYGRLNLVLKYQRQKQQHLKLQQFEKGYLAQAERKGRQGSIFPTLWNLTYQNERNEIQNLKEANEAMKERYQKNKQVLTTSEELCSISNHSNSLFPTWVACEYLDSLPSDERIALQGIKLTVEAYEKKEYRLKYIMDRRAWLDEQLSQLKWEVMPLLRPFHWEDDAAGDQALNQFVSWWDLTRINRKDMVSALIFGIRVSLSVGFLAIGLALLIGIPIGAVAGYYGGKVDLVSYRLIEIWESMPTFFMLLMIVAFLQSKSIFLIITVIGVFGWTSFSRFIRGEFFRQKQLLYVEACRALGYNDRTIIFSHLLPNAIPPLLTLIPFAIMAAITSEAGLSFLGLGEEGSNSWGVLMDEGRTAFPSESYLLWPPAILLTMLLVSIALVGDSLRDALDPKLHAV